MITRESFDLALAQVLEVFGNTKVGSNTVRNGVHKLTRQVEELEARLMSGKVFIITETTVELDSHTDVTVGATFDLEKAEKFVEQAQAKEMLYLDIAARTKSFNDGWINASPRPSKTGDHEYMIWSQDFLADRRAFIKSLDENIPDDKLNTIMFNCIGVMPAVMFNIEPIEVF